MAPLLQGNAARHARGCPDPQVRGQGGRPDHQGRRPRLSRRARQSDRFDFRTPFDSVKQLKTKRTDVDPFTIAEVKQILETVHPDFRHYFTVRFFTGLRTGEIDGLQ